jgi:hypothetical protein
MTLTSHGKHDCQKMNFSNGSSHPLFSKLGVRILENHKRITLAFSCGARTASEQMGKGYLRKMLSRRQLQGFVMPRRL